MSVLATCREVGPGSGQEQEGGAGVTPAGRKKGFTRAALMGFGFIWPRGIVGGSFLVSFEMSDTAIAASSRTNS